jgi:hypothetical protein
MCSYKSKFVIIYEGKIETTHTDITSSLNESLLNKGSTIFIKTLQ